ncbi:bifunctional 4-hydroxy-2-oxoglutarate aldolase/2-dehydro-3-deoxy-phosphogluconate aldolase [Streptomyces yangpuensis]|uniref:bifunctional 4-hydroxy-2-oxoglutarate aldolase/2-dehydro-3-deoxy-phosphogluconate aldolase n=1 Tax=Streptomyces yangpuensis TaxID=1648182 RepID=UPI003719616E
MSPVSPMPGASGTSGAPAHPYAVLAAQRLLPVLRNADADEAVRAAARLLAAGCRAVELTTSTPGWAGAVARTAGLADLHGRRAVIGVGTVTTAAQAAAALDAGAAFLVSPYPAPEVREVAGRRGAVFIEGGFTPAEIATAVRAAGAAKVFPAHVGGPRFVRSLRAVLPDAVLVPTGGIRPEEVPDWIAAGATAVGIGDGLPADPAELAALFADPAGGPGRGAPGEQGSAVQPTVRGAVGPAVQTVARAAAAPERRP